MRGERFFLKPNRPLADMTDDELDSFADAFAHASWDWLDRILGRRSAGKRRSIHRVSHRAVGDGDGSASTGRSGGA